jgi:hypothetical protein
VLHFKALVLNSNGETRKVMEISAKINGFKLRFKPGSYRKKVRGTIKTTELSLRLSQQWL